MTPAELYQAGKLSEAVEAALDSVKKHPTDTQRRGMLCQLLCFAGELERADKQLETMALQDPSSAVGLSLFRQLIRAETARQDFYRDGRVPEFLFEPTPVLSRHLEASIRIREGQLAEAAALLAEAEQQRPHLAGTCDGAPFDDFRDCDDLTAPFWEVLTGNGKYYWIPLERVERVELHAPQRPQDLLWRRAHMVVTEGPDGEVYLPTLYAGTAASGDDQLRLARGTAWTGGEGEPARGSGLRTFLVGDEGRTILEMNVLDFRRE